MKDYKIKVLWRSLKVTFIFKKIVFLFIYLDKDFMQVSKNANKKARHVLCTLTSCL